MEKITIVGGGLVGSLLSIYCAKAGFKVTLYERRSELNPKDSPSGRSINITLCERGFRVLNEVGIGEPIRKLCIPLTGRMIHELNQEPIYHPYGNRQEAIYAIERNELSRTLLNFAQSYQNIDIKFNQKCIDINLPTTTLTLQNTQTGEINYVKAERVFAADGAFSAIRQVMARQERFNYSQSYHEQGYKEIILPPDNNYKSRYFLNKNYLHVWPRGKFMLLGFPNGKGSWTLSLYLPYEGEVSHKSIIDLNKLKSLFADYFPDILEDVYPYLGDYFNKPIGKMITIKCWPWTYQDKVALIGDACHAITPYYGQGANAGFEDCQVLMECFNKHSGNWDSAFQEYQNLRKVDMDIIADLCFENYRVLTEEVADSKFKLLKKIENKIQEIYPHFASLHQNIGFSTMRYSEALEIENKFRFLINRIAAIEGIEKKLDTSKGNLIIRKHLNEFLLDGILHTTVR